MDICQIYQLCRQGNQAAMAARLGQLGLASLQACVQEAAVEGEGQPMEGGDDAQVL